MTRGSETGAPAARGLGTNLHLCEAGFSQTFVTLTGGAFLTGYALALGSGFVLVSWLAAVPFFAQVAQIPGAWLAERLGRRKLLTVLSAALGRIAWLLLIPIAFLGEGPGSRLAMVLVVGGASAIALLGAAPWLSWIADVVPAEARGRWVAIRQQVVGVVTVAAALAGGWLLDLLTASRGHAAAFAVVFGIAAVAHLVSMTLLSAAPDPGPADSTMVGLRAGLREPLRDRSFRRILGAFLLWNVAVGVSAPFFAVYMFENLAMSYTLVGVYTAIVTVTALATNPLWGRLVDRFGVRPVLILNGFLIVLIPLLWLFPRPGWLVPIWFEAVFSGIAWTGFNLAAFSLPLAVTPPQGRTYYLAVLSVATGIGFAAASVSGGAVGKLFEGFHWNAPWGTELLNFHVIFCLSSALRIVAASLMRGFEEPGARATGEMVQFVGYAALKRLRLGPQWLVLPRRREPRSD